MDVKELYEKIEEMLDKSVVLEGWIRNHRKQKELGFIDFYDGTCFKSCQLVYTDKLASFADIQNLHIGSAIRVEGIVRKSPREEQPFEIDVASITLVGDCPVDYPIQPKRHTREFLREVAHLRVRTNLFQAVFRVRSVASYAIHKYFQDHGYVYVQTPLLTANDGECSK